MASSDDLDEFVRLSLTDSFYAKVVFQDVKDFYTPDRDLRCTYAVVANGVQQEGDMIALFKVGWSSISAYVVAVPCQDNTDGDNKKECSVLFEASSLPNEEGEFYQFCYITKGGDIRGGSTPFLFKNDSPDDIVSVEDIENDLLLIQTRTTILEQSLHNSMKEKSKILIDKQMLTNSLQEMKARVGELEELLKEKDEILEELKKGEVSKEAEHGKRVSELQEEICQNEHFISGLRAALTNFAKDKEELDLNIRTVLEDREKLKEIVQGMESKLEAASRKELCLVADISTLQIQIRALKESNRSLSNSLTDKCDLIRGLEETFEAQQTQTCSLTAHLIDAENMLAAMATSKALAAQELQKHIEEQPQIENFKKEMQERCDTLEVALQSRDRELAEIRAKLGDQEAEIEKLKIENDNLDKEKTEVQAECNKLRKDVKELHHRILLGAEEYRRKYVEWHKVNRHYVKLQQKIQNRLAKAASSSTTGSLPPASDGAAEAKANSTSGDSDAQQAEFSQVTIGEEQIARLTNQLNSGLADASSSSATGDADNRQLEFYRTAEGEEQLARYMTQQSCLYQSGDIPSLTEGGLLLSQQQKVTISNEMVNQLRKFQSSSNSSGSSCSDENVEPPSPAATSEYPRYPYPPFYPYPYPEPPQQAFSTPASCERPVEDHEQLSYVLVERPRQPLPNVPETNIRPSPWPPYSNDASKLIRHGGVPPKPHPRNSQFLYPNMAGVVEQTSAQPCASQDSSSSAPFVRCPICAQQLRREEDINEHLDSHLFLTCPICARQYDREADGFEKFNSHVISHLD